MDDFGAVICGAGIAGVEAALRLRRLAGDRVQITLVSPDEELVYRPLAVREPFGHAGARRYPIAQLVEDLGARSVRDTVESVDPAHSTVHTASGVELSYDALLLALGGRERAPFDHAQVFTDRNADDTYHGIVQDIEAGYVTSLVLVQPDGPTWPLPLYELALMTAERADSMNMKPQITLVTPDARPLQAFGGGAAEAVERLLEEAGITLFTGSAARVLGARHVVIEPAGVELHPEQIVTLPTIHGPGLPGIAATEPYGFVPIDSHCRVRDSDGSVFAAGDATDFPIKHGGIAAQQADTAAAGIAHLAGAGGPPPPFEPVIRGMLLTGRKPLYLAADVVEGRGWHSEIYEQPPWPADEKVISEELGPYLRSHESAAPRP
jgi:sulfide:quinone oxidoreductase